MHVCTHAWTWNLGYRQGPGEPEGHFYVAFFKGSPAWLFIEGMIEHLPTKLRKRAQESRWFARRQGKGSWQVFETRVSEKFAANLDSGFVLRIQELLDAEDELLELFEDEEATEEDD